VVTCLGRGAYDLHIHQLIPLPAIIFFFIKIQHGLPFWCHLTQVFLEKKATKRVSLIYYCHLGLVYMFAVISYLTDGNILSCLKW